MNRSPSTATAEVSQADELWCLHVLGPDDVYPAPDRATAQLWAAQWTIWNQRRNPAPDALEPVMSWIVAPWLYGAESHAAGLAAAIEGNTFPVDPLATHAALSRSEDAGEALTWLTECDNLILFNGVQADGWWEVRRGSTKGEVRGRGPTPLDALRDAMPAALSTSPQVIAPGVDINATEIWENLADILSGDPPVELTYAVCEELARRLCTLSTPSAQKTGAMWTDLGDHLGHEAVAIPVNEVVVEEIETRPTDWPFTDEETPSIWRVRIGEHCADFDAEQAARDFAGAILAVLSRTDVGSKEVARVRAEAMEPIVAELEKLAGIARDAVDNSPGLADHKLLILANYGDLALQLAPRFRAALGDIA